MAAESSPGGNGAADNCAVGTGLPGTAASDSDEPVLAAAVPPPPPDESAVLWRNDDGGVGDGATLSESKPEIDIDDRLLIGKSNTYRPAALPAAQQIRSRDALPGKEFALFHCCYRRR